MRRPKMKRKTILMASLVIGLVAVLGCSVDSPTAPLQEAGPPPTTGGNDWDISVSISPDQIVVGTDVPSTVSVRVKARDDGSSPRNGTTMLLSTTVGEFSASGSGITEIGAVIDRGKATASLFPGSVVAGGTLYARLEGSEGRENFQVTGAPQDPFITALAPNSGSENGGTQVTIEGANFAEPLRVTFGTGGGAKLATVQSVTATSIRVITPSAASMNTVACDSNGDLVLDGVRKVDTPATVSVTFLATDGTQKTGSLAGAFTYLATGGCVTDD